ncbi:MAG: TetR/AcrR family transcriptional regulator [Paludibacteraceae bacterium]|nr:TetR/AcrR family transcriptional regulator [Paludibacteraceae bacterium]MBR5971536.1 TetR/AcrR family transcriptional regulator [Paludibacteraceae bacterium]
MNIESREKITRGALDLFLSHGIKTVTMDKIAAALSMSKRTIYEQFSDKDELVTECLKLFRTELDKERDEIRERSENSFIFLLSMFKMSFIKLNGINVRFLQDVETIFSDDIKKCRLNRPSQIAQMRELIRQSQEDGYIDPMLSTDVLATVYYGMLSSLRDKDSYDYSVISPKDALKMLCTIYFRGVATEKGLKLIVQYIKSE